MKAFIQSTFLKQKSYILPLINLNHNSFFTNNNQLLKANLTNNNFYSSTSISKKDQLILAKITSNVNLSENLINNSKKSFSRNSTQWLNRHTNDIYVKKSIEVVVFTH